MDPNAFRVIEPNGDSWVYRRFDEITGTVILTEANGPDVSTVRDQASDLFVGLYRTKLGEREVTWRIAKLNGAYYFKEDPNSKTFPEHQKFALVEGSLVGEDPAERFRFTPDEKTGGLIFEMWNKKSGESQGRFSLKRIDESASQTGADEANAMTDQRWGESVEGFRLGLTIDQAKWDGSFPSPVFQDFNIAVPALGFQLRSTCLS